MKENVYTSYGNKQRINVSVNEADVTATDLGDRRPGLVAPEYGGADS